MGIFGNGNHGCVVDAAAFFDSELPSRIGNLVSMGLLIAIGSTRDRGAISIQATHDGEWTREYFRRPDEAVDWLDGIIKLLNDQGIGVNGNPPAVPQTPRRAASKGR